MDLNDLMLPLHLLRIKGPMQDTLDKAPTAKHSPPAIVFANDQTTSRRATSIRARRKPARRSRKGLKEDKAGKNLVALSGMTTHPLVQWENEAKRY